MCSQMNVTTDTGASFQGVLHEARRLTDEEQRKLAVDIDLVSDFKQNKLETEAKKNWDLFYKRNTTKFFKDRHWTKREFEELAKKDNVNDKFVIFEVGCGVGNFIFPLLEDDPQLFFYACDFSPRAVDFVRNHPLYDPSRCLAFECDVTKDTISDSVPADSVNIATFIFVLSAIHPDRMIDAVRNVVSTLKVGGSLLVRDYGLYDHAMLRFSKGHKLSDCFYVRQDGTRAFYFSVEKLCAIMESAGLKTEHCNYIQRSTVNKKEGLNACRVFVQGKFVRLADPNGVKSECLSEQAEARSNSIADKFESLSMAPDIICSEDISRNFDTKLDPSSKEETLVRGTGKESDDQSKSYHGF